MIHVKKLPPALFLRAPPPILENTIAGLRDVPPFLLETAGGMGMTGRQVWMRVRFPLALPLILTGMKTAAVEIIASATLAARIGAGGMGDLIFTGIGLFRTDGLPVKSAQWQPVRRRCPEPAASKAGWPDWE